MGPITPQKARGNASPQRFSLWQRFLLWLITWTGFLAIRIIGPTLRVAVSVEKGGPADIKATPMIWSFWHNCIFPALYTWRGLGIRVMSSDSFDGEYTGRIIRKFGYVKIRGSSSRGALRGLLEMRRDLELGHRVAFTIDGPRGPRYVAKPGPVFLSKATGVPMLAFYMAIQDAWILNTWDQCRIPKPFSRVLMRVSSLISVPPNANKEEEERFHGELQKSLERVREFAEANVAKAGTGEFPFIA
ncbi:MAG: lysophospholipid acyltransferase family protein [Acidobacteriales bacterium]|nr:lysophospholipid acyltransferase family protein [Terriglobales bacterium]